MLIEQAKKKERKQCVRHWRVWHQLTRVIVIAPLISALFLLSACVIQAPARPGDPQFAPVIGPKSPKPQASPGSLFQSGFEMTLFHDRKAHRIGDIITITLNERTVSSKSSNVSIDKDSDISVEENAAGTAGTVLGTRPSFKNLSLLTDLASGREFSGEAAAGQSNNLQGNITVTIADILPNGNLVVRGEKWMTLNNGDEYIRISGIVRLDDISPDNTVLSTKLANAQISYSGTGSMAESQTMGWISRFFNSPYWPF